MLKSPTVLRSRLITDFAADLALDLATDIIVGGGGVLAPLDIVRAPFRPDDIVGTAGSDDLYGTGGDDRIFGLAGDDYLYGLAGNDELDGREGADVMAGGTGNDIYYVDNIGDVVWEWGGQGLDGVRTSISYTLPTGVEHLQMAHYLPESPLIDPAIDGTGNELANTLLGNDAANRLDGASGNDTLYGLDGSDTLLGGEGADCLDGGAGTDVMLGGNGNDTYVVDAAGDFVIELAGAGTDTVQTRLSDYTLPDAVENLVLLNVGSDGMGSANGTGNALDNIIRGNAGSNVLRGLGGIDTLSGGMGADTFRFATPEECGLSRAAADRLADFNEAEGDRIDLSAIDANVLLAGDQAFSPIGVNVAFNGVAGELRLADGFLEGDMNGDAIADFHIRLDVASLSAAGLVL